MHVFEEHDIALRLLLATERAYEYHKRMFELAEAARRELRGDVDIERKAA